MVFQIERNVGGLLGDENHSLPERVGVTHLVKDVWIATRHVRDDEIGLRNLVVDAIKHSFFEYLFIYSFAICTGLSASCLYSEFVDVAHILIERH